MRQIADLERHNAEARTAAKVRIAELLRIEPPENHAAQSKQKQARGDFATIDRAVEHCRGDPAAIETLEQLASEVAGGKFIKKPAAAWIKRLKDADRFVAQVRPYNENPITAVFDLTGMEEGVAQVLDACASIWKIQVQKEHHHLRRHTKHH